jgi:hypothetical protein
MRGDEHESSDHVGARFFDDWRFRRMRDRDDLLRVATLSAWGIGLFV